MAIRHVVMLISGDHIKVTVFCACMCVHVLVETVVVLCRVLRIQYGRVSSSLPSPSWLLGERMSLGPFWS